MQTRPHAAAPGGLAGAALHAVLSPPRMLALSSASLSFNAGMAPVASVQRMAAPKMMKSAALPFLEAPSKLDGSMAGDKVRLRRCAAACSRRVPAAAASTRGCCCQEGGARERPI